MLQVQFLGRFDVQRDGVPIAIPSRPAQSLFAYLLLNAGIPHRREKLAGLFWSDASEENARSNLRHELWRLRKALETPSPRKHAVKYLLVDEMTIAFDAQSDYSLDTVFLQRTNDATSRDLMESLAVYRGELLPGFYDEWVLLERERLRTVFEQKMARFLDMLRAEKQWSEILDWGERWIALGQTPEPAYRALMVAYGAMGDMAQVAKTFERCAQALQNDLGVEPSEQTRGLYENLKLGKEASKANPSILKAIEKPASASNIPVPLTSFIGREKELKEIARLLSSSRLLTLTGSGGVGKTRLAIQAAKDSIKKFKDGVFWVGLVGLSDANLIPQEIAQSLNVREVSNEQLIDTLKVHLRSKELLIVLDNCEHLIRACAQYAEQLLAACPKLRVLATSIEGLGLFNETIWQVPSLPLPELQQDLTLKELHEFASIELFDERASHANLDFAMNEKNVKSITQICQRLDGIPLAIELAAARIKVLSVDEIASRLDDRFSLLTAGSRTAIPRHQTLRATIDWSYDLLNDRERILFRRLSVFAGGFTLEAAEVVCTQVDLKRQDILDLLARLVDKSLVIVEAESGIGETRYRLLETIRQYALEKLAGIGEAQAIRDQHTEFFVKFAEQAEPKIFSGEAGIWFKRLDKELDNLRTAIEWSMNSNNVVAALRIMSAVVYFIFIHGPLLSEWQDRIKRALLHPEGLARTRTRAKALNTIGFLYWADMYPTDRRSELEEALSIGRELGDRRNIATALHNLGLLASIQSNYMEARSYLEQSLKIWREIGSEGKTGTSQTLMVLGDAVLNYGETEWARSLYAESNEILRELEDINFLAYSIRRLALVAWREENYQTAMSLCQESMILNQEAGDWRGMIACMAGFAAIAMAQGRFERAAKLMAAVGTQLTSIGIRLLPIDRMEYERNLVLLKTKLDERTFARFWAKGKEMSFEESVEFALEGNRE